MFSTTVKIANIILKNPVCTASGTFGYGEEFKEFLDIEKLGAVFTKGISLKPSKGNPEPRVVETPCGILNAIGLENIGIKDFLNLKLPFIQKLNTPFFVNIYGETIEDYEKLTEIINENETIAGIELNVSCPNVKKGGVIFGSDEKLLFDVVKRVRQKTDKCLIVKLTPNITDITKLAIASEKAGADAVSLINTITGMAIDIKKKSAVLGNITGGLSGPAIKPIALRMVWQVSKAIKIPIFGIGGILTAEDAIEFIMAGASAIQVGTGNLINPKTSLKIIKGIQKYLKKNNIKDIKEITSII